MTIDIEHRFHAFQQYCKFLLIITRSGRQAEIWWFVCMLKSHRSLCVSFSRTDSGLCIYYFFVWSNLNFLYNSQWITLPNQSCLFLYSFLLCDWSFRLYYHITYFCCFVASYLFLLWYDWFLWCCFFLLLLGEIQFLSKGFPFLAMSMFFRMICRLLVA